MNDPYQILNIPPTATDEEVKRAYRDLARKYHPDNYHDNPLADLAQEKMKEINEAYDTITKMYLPSDYAYSMMDYVGYVLVSLVIGIPCIAGGSFCLIQGIRENM